MDPTFELIIRQQANIKALIEIDDRIKLLRKSNAASRAALHQVRTNCKQYSLDTVNIRQELLEDQVKEIEMFKEEAAHNICMEVKRQESRLKKLKDDIKDIKEAIEKDRANFDADMENLRKDYEDQAEQVRANYRAPTSSRITQRASRNQSAARSQTQGPSIVRRPASASSRNRDLIRFNGQTFDDPFAESDDEDDDNLMLYTEDIYESNNDVSVRVGTRRSSRISIPRGPPPVVPSPNKQRRKT